MSKLRASGLDRPMLAVIVDLNGEGRERLFARHVGRTTFCHTVLLHNRFGDTIPMPGFGDDIGHEDVQVMMGRPRPWLRGSSLGFGRLLDQHDEPHPLCVRGQLRASNARLRETTWRPRIGLEIECVAESEALRRDGGTQTLYGELLDGRVLGQYTLDVFRTGLSMGLPLESAGREYADAQVEFATSPQGAVAAADDGFLLRRLMVYVAERNGVLANLSPQPRPSGLGSGLHINVSLASMLNGRPWTWSMAEDCASAMAENLDGICALLVPRTDGYDRLQNSEFSSYEHVWAVRSRDTMMRLAGRRASPRLEIRIPDPTCNIHLAIAGVLELLTEAVNRLKHASGPVPRARSRRPLPTSLHEALERLTTHSILRRGFNDQLLDAYVGLKRSEIAAGPGARGV